VNRAFTEHADVPVALFVHRRHEQLPRTLACLRACGIRQLHVFSDGPRDAAEADGVARVRELLGDLDWIDAVTVAHAENLGLSRSIRAGLDSLFAVHEQVIVIEDDVCVAPEFYEYTRLALRQYASSKHVAGVTGLRYPFSRKALAGYPWDVFLAPRFSSWAWATWKDRWSEFCFDRAELRRRIAAASDFRPERAGADMPAMIDAAVVKGTLRGSWDVVCATNMLLRGDYFVTPAWNMVENTGLSEGTHADRPPPWELRWELDYRPALPEIRFASEEDERVLREYRRFFKGNARRALFTASRHVSERLKIMRRLRLAGRSH
jgi:hypothetical protein